MKSRWPPLETRLLAKSVIRANGCIEWTGAIKPNGYGVINAWGRQDHTHRVAYILANGPIPVGKVIDHLCRNRKCVNPNHLEAVTQSENLHRGANLNFIASRNGTCRKGHVLTQSDLKRKDGRLRCRICRNERRRKIYISRKKK